MTEKMDIKKFSYLKNALGEDITGNCPDTVEEWYDTIELDKCDWLLYLAKYSSDYGILAIHEVTHPETITWDYDYHDKNKPWKDMTSTDIKEHLKKVADKIQAKIKNTVILGLYSGFGDSHELAIWFPMKTNNNDSIYEVLNSLENIEVYNVSV